jgi:hypothetical protein
LDGTRRQLHPKSPPYLSDIQRDTNRTAGSGKIAPPVPNGTTTATLEYVWERTPKGGGLAETGRVAIFKKSDKLWAGRRTRGRRGTMNRSSVIRFGVLLLALGLIVLEREWIWNAAYFLWVHFYWFVSKFWQF